MNDAASHSTDSLWLAMAPPTAYPALDGDLEFDAAVIGGGIAGVIPIVVRFRGLLG